LCLYSIVSINAVVKNPTCYGGNDGWIQATLQNYVLFRPTTITNGVIGGETTVTPSFAYFRQLRAGTYTITATQSEQLVTQEVVVESPNRIVISFPSLQSYPPEVVVHISGGGGSGSFSVYLDTGGAALWYPGFKYSGSTLLRPGVHTVRAVDSTGCSVSSTFTIAANNSTNELFLVSSLHSLLNVLLFVQLILLPHQQLVSISLVIPLECFQACLTFPPLLPRVAHSSSQPHTTDHTLLFLN